MPKQMSGVIVARGGVRFQCSWHATNSTITHTSDITSWRSINISFKVASRSPEFSWPKSADDTRLSIELSADKQHQVDPQDFGSVAAFHFVLDCLSAADHEHGSVARLVVPQSRGYVVRSDIISLRLLDFPLVRSVVSFSKPHQFFGGKPINTENLQQLPNIFAASAGGMLLKHIDSTGINALDPLLTSLDLELRNRLSFPWISMQVPKRQTLAIVDGGLRGPDHWGTGGSIYIAAEALGIDIVVLDDPEHWVNGPRYSNWCKALVPLKLQPQADAGFVSRIVEAIRSYKGQVDGLLTFHDHYKLPVAEAALQLSLPTYSPLAYEIAAKKFKTSLSEGRYTYRASSIEQASRIVQEHNLEFPLIIKPCNGFLSEGVFRAENLLQLETSIRAIDADWHGREFVIEKCSEGPKVDANLVLCDGELIFFEASDNFPGSVDLNGQGKAKTITEPSNVFPSNLPETELAILRDSLHQSLLRMGFQDGFYHLEARVENSSMEYVRKNNVLDLAERSIPTNEAPSSRLIELNPRLSGIQASEAVKYAYGIDYFGLALLFALNDKHRVKQLSHPYAQGPQYWCKMVFIPVEKGGVYNSKNVCTELFDRRPDLAAYVSGCFCFLEKGDRVSDPIEMGVNSWVAYFNVYSRESRAHLLEIAECIRREVTFSIV